jgi:DNA-binding HxlR family transcriptional regulator
VRRDFGTVPPRVEYELTELGRSLLPLIDHMQAWGIAHLMQKPPGGAPDGFAMAASRE